MAKSSGGSGRGGGGGRMSGREFSRLASGKLRKGDYVFEGGRSGSRMQGRIISAGTLGRGRNAVEGYRVRLFDGREGFFPKRTAYAAGIAGARPAA